MAVRALHHALELAERPSLAALMRKQSLPPDVVLLLRMAAGSPEALAEAAAQTGRSPKILRDAGTLYLQQILFHPGADAYRILGAAPEAAQEDLSQHMRLLMKWLHPDQNHSDWGSAFAERVSGAWDQLKSAERRAEYDLSLAKARPARTVRARKSRRRRPTGIQRLPSVERPAEPGSGRGRKIAAGSAAAVILVAIALAVLMGPEATAPWADSPADPAEYSSSAGGNAD